MFIKERTWEGRRQHVMSQYPIFQTGFYVKKKKKKPNNFIIFCQVEVSHTELPESHDDSFVLSL